MQMQTTKNKSAQVEPQQADLLGMKGQEVMVLVGSAVAYNCVATRFLHARVEHETEKAVLLKNKAGQAWFSKKSIKNGKLAHWMTLELAQKRMVDACEVSHVTVAGRN